jgi:hypothetical protein
MLSDDATRSRIKMHGDEEEKNHICSMTGRSYQQPELGPDGKYYCPHCGKPVQTTIDPLIGNPQRMTLEYHKKISTLP